jgi:hypothetical protein
VFEGAALSRLQFIEKKDDRLEELKSPTAAHGTLPLKQVADLYFKQLSMPGLIICEWT